MLGALPTCTGKYNALVTNGIGGSLDNPCAIGDWGIGYCNSADADAWLVTADNLFFQLRRAWNDVAARVKQENGSMPQEVYDYVAAIEKDYCTTDANGLCTSYKLPRSHPLNISHNLRASTEIARWCSRVACALELLDGVRGFGIPVEKPPDPDKAPKGPPGPTLGGVPLVAVGLGLLTILFLVRR